ncbi:hypothetical protein LTR40_005896 [Exophiala xenobiotica]|nr:hypothetical protein LTR40_005896 [Exophiala xenobiotica]
MKQYAWAYAPTVIAVVIVAAWRMVDYHSKLAMPFDALQDGPLKPSESLFVDYISKFQLVALYEAIKSNHFAVITTVTGFVLLKIVTVFSTGLLVLLPTQVTQKDALIQARGFSSEAFDPSASLDSLSLASPVYAYYGSKTQGIPLENGVAFDLAYGALTVSSNTSIGNDAVISGNVTAFVPNMTCIALEEVKLDTPAIVNDTNSADAFATSSNISFTIQAGHACSQSTSISVPADNPYTEIVSGRQVTGTMQEIYCGTTAENVPDSQGPLGLLFTLTDIEYQQTLFDNATQLAGGTFTIASDVSRTLTNMTNVFCKPSYAMARVKVTNNTQLSGSSQAVSVEPIEGSVSSLPNFSNWNSTNVFLQSATSANALFGDIVNDDTSSNSSGIFTLMALTAGSQDIGSLMEPGKMMSAAEDTYKGVLSQYAYQSLRAASRSDVAGGTLTKQERRLRVNDVSAWTMASIFGLLVICCIALIFIAPRAVVPRDPSSIAAIATLLTRSTELNRLLRKQGVPSYANQRSALSGFEFGTAIATTDAGTTSFKIVASEGEPDPAAAKSNMDLKWWMPFTASIPVLIIALVLPLVLIAVLEVIQQSSDKHHGLLTVVDDKWTEVYNQSQVTTMICYQEIQKLQANVTLRDNTTIIDASNPPIVQEGSVSIQSNPASTTGAKSFDFRIQNNLAQEMTLFNAASGTPITNPSATNTFDIYFQAIINGTNKHDPASLVGAKNQNILVDAINQFYRIYMAQAFSTNMRTSLTTSSSRLGRRQSAITTSTTATTVTTPRLVQDKDSKLELQIILGIITVLAGASWLTTKMRRVLPCNPCSLAGTMSLLAGSDLCHSADEGLCECCGKPRRRSFGYGDAGTRPESIHAAPDDDDEEDDRQQIIPDGAEWMPQPQFETVFGGKRYSMGWWRERRAIGKRRRFGVDVGVRADGADDQDWELGERRPEGPGFSDFMRRGGDRDGRGEYARFGGGRGRDLSPDPAAVEASALEEREVVLARPPRAASPNPSCPVHGAGGDPPPRAVSHQREGAYLLGGEA